MTDPTFLARQIALNQEVSDAAERWIVGAFTAWWRDGSNPERLPLFLRLPTGSRQAIAERNRWLVTAAGEISGPNRAAALKKRLDAFLAHTWPKWRGSKLPPEGAAVLEQALFFAADQGANMRLTRRQVGNILAGK